MKELHAHMREIADIVIFDSPPALAAADAQVLASEVNGVIVVSVMGNARKSALHFLGELMAQVNAKMLGVVVNKVPADRKRTYGYGYGYGTGYGYGSYYGYGRYYYTYGADYGAKIEDDRGDRGFRAEFEALPHAREDAPAGEVSGAEPDGGAVPADEEKPNGK